MEDKKRELVEMKYMFPGVKPERVEELLQNPDFQARQAMANLSLELRRMQEAGQDVSGLSSLLDKAYTPSMQALGDKLKAGWNNSEQSAAHMVTEGTVKIR